MPKIEEIEFTPNPNARKFVLREPLTFGLSRSFESAEQAAGDALARELFAMAHVTNVFYVDRWLTVTQDGKAHWPELLRELAVPIRGAPSAQERSAELLGGAGETDLSGTSPAPASGEDEDGRLPAIRELLDREVRPYLQGDGGDLYVLGIDGNTLKVHYQGACGSCPSSLSGTLAGIEGLVQRLHPEMDVMAV